MDFSVRRERMKRRQIQQMTEGALMLALSFILNNIRIFRMPQGGSVSLAGYVPLLIYAIRWGLTPGLILGTVYGFLEFIVDPFIIHPLQAFLDYPAAYMAMGLAGLGKSANTIKGKIDGRAIGAILLAVFIRAVVAITSGVIFFKETLPEDLPYITGSAIYNFSYIIPNTIIAIIVILLIYGPITKARPIIE